MAFFLSTARAGLAPVGPVAIALALYAGESDDLQALTRAIIATESAWNVGAYRWEPRLQDASHGLMQILHRTATLYEPAVTPGDLFIPDINLRIGTRHLRMLLDRYDFRDAIAAYNAGSPQRDASGTYVNQAYVDTVLAYYTYYLAAAHEGEFLNPAPLAGGGAILDFLPGEEILEFLTTESETGFNTALIGIALLAAAAVAIAD